MEIYLLLVISVPVGLAGRSRNHQGQGCYGCVRRHPTAAQKVWRAVVGR